MLVRRVYDAQELNVVVNDPSVHPWVATGPELLDLTAVAQDFRNVVLLAEGGAFVALWQEPGVYEVHTQFVATHRGKGAVLAARDALHYIFTATDAQELLTKVPRNNPAALGLARLCHWRREYEHPRGWLGQPCEYWALRYNDWLWTTPSLQTTCDWFHGRLQEECARIGAPFEDHPLDPHDRPVGATVAMILAGQVEKGLILYARFARVAGYTPMTLCSRVPLVIDIGECLLAVQGEDFVALPKSGAA